MRRTFWAYGVFAGALLAISIPPIRAQEITKTLTAPSYEILCTDEDSHRIRMDGFAGFLIPGKPRLPAKTVEIALPPGAHVRSLEIVDADQVSIDGCFRIPPAPPVSPAIADPERTAELLDHWAQVRRDTYESDTPFPASPVELVGQSARGSRVFARIRFAPFRYSPKSGNLELFQSVSVSLSYATGDIPESPAGPARDETYPYVIITTDSLVSAVDTLATWKTYLGLPATIVTDSWIAGNYAGQDTPERVRNFLIDTYEAWGIQYVLIVSDSTGIPMRMCTPTPNNPYQRVPSDHYYADLTGDWDSDGDGYWGEHDDDDVDFVPEVFVGRIPFAEVEIVESVCLKLISFEADTTAWKKDALLAGAILNFQNEMQMGRPRTDGAELMEILRTDLLTEGTCRTLYEQAGINPCPYPSTRPLLKYWMNYEWETHDFGLVTWHSHGDFDEGLRKYWEWDDGDGIPEIAELETNRFLEKMDAGELDDDHPSVVFACACSNGDPEYENLALALLEQGAASVVAATQPGYYANGWADANDGGIASIDYYFFDALVGGEKVGQSLFTSKQFYFDNFFWWGDISQQNLLVFNLYGDPALTQIGIGGLEPEIIALSPEPNDTESPMWTEIAVTFSKPMRAGTFTDSSFVVHGALSGTSTGTLTYDADSRALHFQPEPAFAPGEPVTVVLTEGVSSLMGMSLDHSYAFTFFTKPFDGTGSFPTTQTFGGFGNPSTLVAADFNGDRAPDLAVGIAGFNPLIYVFLSSGDGTFSGPTAYPAVVTPSALVSGDLDGDGRMDLVLAGDGKLVLLPNDGTGGFPSSIDYALGNQASDVTLGDLDGDGRTDVLVVDAALDSLWVLPNQGGVLGTPVSYWAGPKPSALAVSDLNGDGLMDVVCGPASADSLVLFMNTGGLLDTPTTVAAEGPVSDIVCGDLDGDGDVDVAVSKPEEDCVHVLLNSGGVLSGGSSCPTGDEPQHLAVTDFDGDGKLDLATADFESESVTVLLNKGEYFESTQWSAGGPTKAIAVCDTDGDADVDLVAVTARTHNNVTVFRNEDDLTPATEEATRAPMRLALHQNTPNPFNPSTEIRFDLPRTTSVTLTIYDVSGRRVRELVSEILPAGTHRSYWDGKDEHGQTAASGVYLCRLATEEGTLNNKMVLIK